MSRLRRRPLLPALALAASALSAPGAAQDAVVIYRCTAADGSVTVQNDEPCRRGSREQRRVLEATPPPSQPYIPPPRPAPAATAVTAAPELLPMPADPAPPATPAPVEVETAIEPERQPPPPLFACTTWEREDYLTDSEVPAERCAAMRTTGLDGSPAGGAGAACMVVVDACQPVPEAELCTRWQDLLRTSEATVQLGRADDPAAARAELERVRAIVGRNLCDG